MGEFLFLKTSIFLQCVFCRVMVRCSTTYILIPRLRLRILGIFGVCECDPLGSTDLGLIPTYSNHVIITRTYFMYMPISKSQRYVQTQVVITSPPDLTNVVNHPRDPARRPNTDRWSMAKRKMPSNSASTAVGPRLLTVYYRAIESHGTG